MDPIALPLPMFLRLVKECAAIIVKLPESEGTNRACATECKMNPVAADADLKQRIADKSLKR